MVRLAVLNYVDDPFLLVSCHIPIFFKTRVTKSLSSCRDPSHLTLTFCSPFAFLSFILTFASRLLYIGLTARNSTISFSSLLLEVSRSLGFSIRFLTHLSHLRSSLCHISTVFGFSLLISHICI